MKPRKSVRILKKVRLEKGVWRVVCLRRSGNRYVWDDRPGLYFLEWWEGTKRRREAAGETPSEALEAQRRKRFELIGQLVDRKSAQKAVEPEAGSGMRIREGVDAFLGHGQVHSPDEPKTVARYRAVMDHFEHILGRRLFVESSSRGDIDHYKAARRQE